MLSPRAVHLFLKYFDSIDESLTRRLVRKRPWDEESLTFLLTELLDKESQQDHKLSYSHESLIDELSNTDEPLSIDVSIETHSYNKSMERYVTQSDIGFIISYQNQFKSNTSFRTGWLMQAKRLFPSKQSYETQFSISSSFKSYDKAQHERMVRLRKWANCDFIRYMLYCPRPATLDDYTREHLSAVRTEALSSNIFDYILGLELRDDLISSNQTVAAGIFVTPLSHFPKTLLDVHKSIFRPVTPFSWFVVSLLAQKRGIDIDNNYRQNLNNPIIEGLIRGDASVIEEDDDLKEVLGGFNMPKILPAHTIEVCIINGIDRPRDHNKG